MKKTARTRNNKNGKPSILKKLGLRNILVLVAGITLYQYFAQGEISWPAELYRQVTGTLSEYTGRPDAGWRKATDAIEDLGASREGQRVTSFDLEGRVVRVADGDTVSILDEHGRQHKIRLFGIDTPERDQRYGKAASRALAGMVSSKTVGVVTVETDDYGRTVGTLYQGDRNINLAMVAGGHAWWYRRYAPYERHLAAAQETARRERRGLWSGPQPVPPWDWRRAHR